jgi:glycosyltransferase involved in cell wall biosynthesis
MSKPSGASPGERSAVVLSPEAPYPIVGGGALRTASVIEYLRRRYEVNLITFRESDRPDPRASFPPDVRVHVIELPFHSKRAVARALRNSGRACRSVPPLVDRFGGFEAAVRTAIGDRRFDLGVIEHFWCAPYFPLLRAACKRVVLNVHNVESVLARRQADAARRTVRWLASHFADCYARLEQRWLPEFDELLVTSEVDRAHTGRGIVYPNAVPELPLPRVEKRDEIAFSGNFGYEPNQSAVRWFRSGIWPDLRERRPGLTWRLIGRNEECIRKLVARDSRIVLSGSIADAVTEIARARAVVVPVLAGSGTRFKIVEAWAAGVPVISTTIGAEGLPATPDKHLRIADTPAKFLSVIEEVLASTHLQRQLGMSGRQLYEQRLTWTAAWKVLETAGF